MANACITDAKKKLEHRKKRNEYFGKAAHNKSMNLFIGNSEANYPELVGVVCTCSECMANIFNP